MVKQCKKCLSELPLEAFNRQRTGRLGRHSRCKECRADDRKDRRDKDYPKELAWRKANPDKRKATNDRYYLRHRGDYANRNAKRRANLKEQTPQLSPSEKSLVKEVYQLAQEITLETGVPYEVDHIVPLSKGGLHHPDNMQILTRHDNRVKGAKLACPTH